MRENKWVALYPVLYRVAQVVLLVLVCLMGFNRYVGIVQAEQSHGIIAGIALFLIAFINYRIWNEKIISAVVLMLFVFFVVPFLGSGQVSDFWSNYWKWLFTRPDYNVEYTDGYEWIQTIWAVCGCYIFEVLSEKKSFFKDILAFFLSVNLIICIVKEVVFTKPGAVFVISYLVIYYIEKNQHKWKIKDQNKGYLVWILPFCVLYIFLLFKMPVQKEPYDWGFVRDAYDYVKGKIIIYIESTRENEKEDFSLLMSGFSEDGKLKGEISNSEKILIRMERKNGHANSIYLRGKIYDSFSGREWKQNANNDKTIQDMDMLETVYALKRYDNEHLTDYIEYNRVGVQYEYFNTGILFTPSKVRIIDGVDYVRKGSDYLFNGQKGYGTEYELTFYQLNQQNPDFENLFNAKLQNDTKVWEYVVNMYDSGEDEKYSLSDLDEYQQQMKQIYSDEVQLSERVKTYIEGVTVGCKTKLERLKAIEQGLSEYEYTQRPGELPENVTDAASFLEYLLFDSKQGYCSHYATAFVLLARNEGFPARYVEGFCVPPRKEAFVEVTPTMLHAWPEVYVENVGWISFEPTPGYGSIRYRDWSWKNREDARGAYYDDYGKTTTDSFENEKQELLKKQQKKEQMTTITILILEVVMVCLMICFAEIYLMKKRYRNKTQIQKFLVYVKCNLWIWSRLGYRRQGEETLEELHNRVILDAPDWTQEKTEWMFINGYQEYLYREESVSAKIYVTTMEEYMILLEWMKKERKWQYIMVRIRSLVQWGI